MDIIHTKNGNSVSEMDLIPFISDIIPTKSNYWACLVGSYSGRRGYYSADTGYYSQ